MVASDWGEGRDGWAEHGIFRAVKTLCVILCNGIFVRTHRMYSSTASPRVNCGLWRVTMCQYRFSVTNATPVGVFVKGVMCLGAGNSVFYTKFCCEPKIALENKVYY